MKKNILLVIIAVVACALTSYAQGRKGLYINEVMVQNDSSSVIDDYGLYHGWIELFNSTYAPMDISSVFLTNDANEPKKYPVPLGDVKTEMPPRQHVIFWADNEPNKGTFHLSFKLEAGKDNWIGIYDADGITLIDSVTVPAALVPNVTWAREADGEGAGEVRDGSDAKYITPSSNNVIIDTNNKVDMFAEKDSNGFVLTLMAMAIVFSALLVLSICFYVISKIGEQISRVNKLRAQGIAPEEVAKGEKINDSGEEIAAIVMALHEHLNAHDQENTILTINKVKRAYSPWSSKIYGLRELPRR